MPSEDAAPRTREAEEIRTPDQLQQAKRDDRRDAGAPADPRTEGRERPSPEGVLGQLRTERAHD